MARGGGMQDVELVDAPLDDAVAADGEPAPDSARRRRWWVVPVAAGAVVLALVAYQGITDARERSLLARLADVPGVLTSLEPDLRVRWEVTGPTTQAAVYGTLAEGASTNIVVGPDGTQRVVAIDLETGAERWSTVVYGPNPGLAAAREGGAGTSTGYCLPIGPDAGEPTSLACVVSDGYETYGENYTQVPATETLLRILDLHDGHELAHWPTDDNGVGVSDGHVVLARWTDDGAIDVAAHEPASGATLWTRHLDVPDPAIYRERAPSIRGIGDIIEVSSGGWSARLDEDGTPLAVQPENVGITGGSWVVEAPTPDRLLSVSYSNDGTSSTEVLSADGTIEHTLLGDLTYISADDGSVPNLILTLPSRSAAADGGDDEIPLGGLRGSDLTTGRTLWTADVSTAGYEALVLLGRVYVLGGQGIVALDGRSGKVLWTVEPPDGVTYTSIMTDGRHVLGVRSPGLADSHVIDAYDLIGGAQAWSAPIPEDLDEVHATGGALLGIAYEESMYGGNVSRVVRLG